MRRRLSHAFAAAALAALISGGLAAAAPGDLDPTFHGKGWVRTYDILGYTRSYFAKGAEDIAVQPDGKILAVSELQDGGSNYYFGVLRWTANGDLDPSFGVGGWAITKLGDLAIAHAVVLQRDGKIVVAGEGDCPNLFICFVLVRYNRDGTIDRGFGVGGVVHTPFRQCGCIAYDVAVQRDGKIIAVGQHYYWGDHRGESTFAVARYLPAGRLDPSFSRDGRASVNFGPGHEHAYAVTVLRSGRILVAGSAEGYYSGDDDFAFARLLPNGTLDRAFSGDGRQTVSFGRFRVDRVHSFDIQRNGRIVAAGESSVPPRLVPMRIGLVRLKANGALDRRFGKHLLSPVRNGGAAGAVLVQPDGRILVAGLGYDDPDGITSAWVLARYLSNGRLDRSFGRSGIVVSDFGTGADWAGAIAMQSDGKILVGGSVYEDQAIARYRAH